MGPFNFDYPGSWWRLDDEEQKAADARTREWEERRAAAEDGQPVLTLIELGSLIKQTEATLPGLPAHDRARVRRKLEAMKLEFLWRDFLREHITTWPR